MTSSWYLPKITELARKGLCRSVLAFHVRFEVMLELVGFEADVALPRSLISKDELKFKEAKVGG